MDKHSIDTTVTIQEAMKKIDIVQPKIVFIIDEKKLIASLTDGDIRRFLLQGGSLEDLAIQAANHTPLSAGSRKEAIRLYHQRDFVAIPILNADNELVEIYFGNQKSEKVYPALKIPVVINAGGKGTRLEPYTKILPKPLIPVGEKPIIEHIMERFTEYSCTDFHMIVHYKKEIMKAYFKECDKNYALSWYEEKEPLGTGGGLSLLRGKLNSTFFFSNCDNLLLSDYDSILKFHQNNENVITMVCAYKNVTIPYGIVDMGMNGVVESMSEKPEFSYLTNTGIYIVEPDILEDIRPNSPIGFPDIIQEQKKKGKRVAVYPVSGNEWLDMGQMSELKKMEQRLYGEG